MPPRIAIPMPHSFDSEYAERAIPQYEHAVRAAGGEPVRFALDQSPAQTLRMMEGCDGVLLPGSKADVDPARFRAARSPHTATADPRRDAVDDILLQHAYRLRKPVLGICYGLQSLNVYRAGSLVQHIPDFLPEELRAKVNHEAGKNVAVAHAVEIESGSKLARVVRGEGTSGAKARTEAKSSIAALKALRHPKASLSNFAAQANKFEAQTDDCTDEKTGTAALEAPLHPKPVVIPVNSSHHQSADAIGDGLRIVARCTDDGIIEALEGTAPDHFVLAVQWHPERSVGEDATSRSIFHAFLAAAREHSAKAAGRMML